MKLVALTMPFGSLTLQKQSFADVLQNRCSLQFRKFHSKTPVLESLFNKVTGLASFPVKLTKILKTPFYTETYVDCL